MAKKRLPDDRMDRFLSKKERAGKALAEHIENLERTQSEHIENTDQERFEGYKKTELETFSIRLSAEDKRKLREYFEKRSIPMSQGIRSIIISFMEETGLK